jgi:hypothetical protein
LEWLASRNKGGTMDWRYIGMALLTAVSSHATSAVAQPTASAVLAGASYQVTATTQLSGSPALLSGGLNLLRVDGAAPAVLGVMHDDGLNGDAVANDGIYTFQFTAASVSQMQLQASAALTAQVRRLKSPTTLVPIVVPSLTMIAPNSGTQGQSNLSVTIAGHNTHFSQGTTAANFGAGITVVSLTVNSATSATAVLNVTADAALGSANVTVTSGLEAPVLNRGFTVTTANLTADVYTWHYDTTRSGLNPNETTLTPANVVSSSFGKLAEFPVDGQIDGQVLYLHQVNIPTVGMKNVVYFATENDSVYALDAASLTGSSATVLWKASVAGSGETAATSLPCGPTPTGVMATPVIDRARNAIYVVSMSQNSSHTTFHRLHALDLATGAELFGGPTTITATYPGSGGNSQNGTVTFDPSYQHDRAALLESGNTIYSVWSGLDGDCGRYSPWVISYSADTLTQPGALDLAPNNYGGGMWMGGAGPSADAEGNVYTISGNGFGGTPEGGTPTASYNNSMVKLTSSGGLAVADYFTPDNTTSDNQRDLDFGSAGPLLLPDLMDGNNVTHHLAVSGGKDGVLYVVNRDDMGEYSSAENSVYQQIALSTTMNFSTPVYFNGTVYVCPSGSSLKAFPVSNAMLVTPPASSSNTFGGSGAVVSLSSNAASDGIVWALDWTKTELFAYEATDIATAIYTSSQAANNRDRFSSVGGHFVTPTVVDGKVYFGTGSTLAVFGLLP